MKLSDFPNILSINSTREDGNMSLPKGDLTEASANRKRFLEKYGVDQIVSLKQVHSTIIFRVTKENISEYPKEGDGLITSEKNIYLALHTADCIPLAAYDRTNRAIGLIHMGRWGLDQGIIKSTIEKFKQEFNSNPKDLIIEFGPSIGPCCYLLSYPYSAGDNLEEYSKKVNNQQFSIDIWSYATDQLQDLGVLPDNIHNPKICTYHSGKYFSHRQADAEKLPNDYNFITVLGMN